MKLTFERKANRSLQAIIPQKAIASWQPRGPNTKVNIFHPEYLDFLHNAMWKKKPVKVTIEWESPSDCDLSVQKDADKQ